MTNVRRRTFLIVPVLATFLLGAVAIGHAQAIPGGPATRAPLVEDDLMFDAPEAGLAECTGGAQEAALVKMRDSETNLNDAGAFLPLPGATQNINVPNGDSDQLIVTFSAEAALHGQTNPLVAPVDFLQIQILLNGVPMPPLNDLAFTTDGGQSDAAQTCKRVGPGNYVVSVVYQLINQPTAGLTATLDDWTLHVEVNA